MNQQMRLMTKIYATGSDSSFCWTRVGAVHDALCARSEHILARVLPYFGRGIFLQEALLCAVRNGSEQAVQRKMASMAFGARPFFKLARGGSSSARAIPDGSNQGYRTCLVCSSVCVLTRMLVFPPDSEDDQVCKIGSNTQGSSVRC